MNTESEILRVLQQGMPLPLAQSLLGQTRAALGVPSLENANRKKMLQQLESVVGGVLTPPDASELRRRIECSIPPDAPHEARMRIEGDGDLSKALRRVRKLCTALGCEPLVRSRAVVITSELCANILDHSAGGEIAVRMDTDAGMLEIVASDRGPGIADVEGTLAASRITRTQGRGLGGLGIMQNAAFSFELESDPAGTTVRTVIKL